MATPIIDPIVTAFTPEQFPPEKGTEIVMAGRSNVGKSSLINQFLGKTIRSKARKGARVSQTPGCTQSINLYPYLQDITLVDLPGFGYAAMPRTKREQLKVLVEAYFNQRTNVALLVHIVDARLDLQPLDWQMVQWGKHFNYPYLLTLNKCDKLSRSLLSRRKQEAQRMIEREGGDMRWITVSALTGDGVAQLRKLVQDSAQEFLVKQAVQQRVTPKQNV